MKNIIRTTTEHLHTHPDLFEKFRNAISRPSLQPFFRSLLKLCHMGMNYGGGQDVKTSGEMTAMEIALNKAIRKQDLILFDVGAHHGEYSRHVLSATNSFSNIYCFEPSLNSFKQLCATFYDEKRVRCHNLAFGNNDHTLHLTSEREHGATARIIDGTKGVRSEEIRVSTIDHFLEDQQIPVIDFLKIDTEGFEVPVLEGASQAIANNQIEMIQFEFGETFLPYGRSLQNVFDLLAPNYSIYRILRNGIVPITYSYDWEIYKISNFLCLKK